MARNNGTPRSAQGWRPITLDSEGGAVTPDRIWMRRVPAGLLCIGMAPSEKLARFAFTGDGDHPFFDACRRLEHDLAREGIAKARRLGIALPAGAIAEQPLRRLA